MNYLKLLKQNKRIFNVPKRLFNLKVDALNRAKKDLSKHKVKIENEVKFEPNPLNIKATEPIKGKNHSMFTPGIL